MSKPDAIFLACMITAVTIAYVVGYLGGRGAAREDVAMHVDALYLVGVAVAKVNAGQVPWSAVARTLHHLPHTYPQHSATANERAEELAEELGEELP